MSEEANIRPTSVTAACGSTAAVEAKQNNPIVYQKHCHGCRFTISADGTVSLTNHDSERLCFFKPGDAPVGTPKNR